MKHFTLAYLLIGILALSSCKPQFTEWFAQEGRFSVIGPGVPNHQFEDILDFKYRTFTSCYEKADYMVGYDEYPDYFVDDEDPQGLIMSLLDGLLAAYNPAAPCVDSAPSESPTPFESDFIEYEGYPGIQFVGPCGYFECKGEAYLIGRRFYYILVAYEYGTLSQREESVNRFVDSFKYNP